MNVPAGAPATSRRHQRRQATLQEIVAVARDLLSEPGGLSLRAVAQQMGITAPALYRYVASYQDLVALLAEDIDQRTATRLAKARDRLPADDPAARLTAVALEFRRWALSHREEFALVFTNPRPPRSDAGEPPDPVGAAAPAGTPRPETVAHDRTGLVFTELLLQLWLETRFALPPADDLDPAVLEALEETLPPGRAAQVPDSARGLLWVFIEAWVALYGTVAIEVFAHCDPRISASGALFRSMLAAQADLLGISAELPRLAPLIESELAR